jgi:hypothetical protein
MDRSTEEIRIAPVIIGSKRAGVFQTILGVALVAVAAFVTGGAAIGIGGTAFAGGWGAVAGIGASMAIGGVVQMLSPQTTGLASKQSADNQASYAFGGVTNTTAQGIRYHFFMAAGESAARLFLPGFMSKISNKLKPSFRPPSGGFFYGRNMATAIAIKGRKGGSSSSRTPTEQPDDLQSVAKAKILVALGEGNLQGN